MKPSPSGTGPHILLVAEEVRHMVYSLLWRDDVIKIDCPLPSTPTPLSNSMTLKTDYPNATMKYTNATFLKLRATCRMLRQEVDRRLGKNGVVLELAGPSWVAIPTLVPDFICNKVTKLCILDGMMSKCLGKMYLESMFPRLEILNVSLSFEVLVARGIYPRLLDYTLDLIDKLAKPKEDQEEYEEIKEEVRQDIFHALWRYATVHFPQLIEETAAQKVQAYIDLTFVRSQPLEKGEIEMVVSNLPK